MLQWEYVSILGRADTILDQTGQPVPLQAYLNQMGHSGWELVAVTPQPAGVTADPCYVYQFKRPCAPAESSPNIAVTPSSTLKREIAPQTASEDDLLPGGFCFGGGPVFFGNG